MRLPCWRQRSTQRLRGRACDAQSLELATPAHRQAAFGRARRVGRGERSDEIGGLSRNESEGSSRSFGEQVGREVFGSQHRARPINEFRDHAETYADEEII